MLLFCFLANMLISCHQTSVYSEILCWDYSIILPVRAGLNVWDVNCNICPIPHPHHAAPFSLEETISNKPNDLQSLNSPSLHSSCWLLDWGETEMATCHGTTGTTDDIKLSDQTPVSLLQPEIINRKPFAYLKLIYIFQTKKQSPTHTIFQLPIKKTLVNELFNITAFQGNGLSWVFAAHFKA